MAVNQTTFRTLLSEKQYLKVARRAGMLHNSRLVAVLYNNTLLKFRTESGTHPGKFWTQEVRIEDMLPHLKIINTANTVMTTKERGWHIRNALKGTPVTSKEIDRLLLNSPIKIHCDCIAEGTRIKVRRGYKKIEEILPGDEVLTKEGTWAPVIKLLDKGERNTVAVNICGEIDPLVLTEDHKVWTRRFRDKCACGCGKSLRPISEKYEKAKARGLWEKRKFIPKHAKRPVNDGFAQFAMESVKDLRLGYSLTSPVVKSEIEFDPEKARMIGYYLAEGHVNTNGRGNGVYITLNQNEEDTVAKDILNYFGSCAKCERKSHKDQKWLLVTILSKEFKEECLEYCGRFSKQKSLNSEVLSWSKEAKRQFLLGHLLGDGAVASNGFRWMSTSRDMIDDLKLLLNSLGLSACMSYALKNEGSASRSPVYQVKVPLNEFIEVYNKKPELLREKDANFLKNKSRGRNSRAEDWVLRTVLDVKPAGIKKVYDLSLLDESHSFIANGLCVSNCPAYLYWGFRYIATKNNYALYPIHKRPKVRNPRQQGWTCKHLYRVFTVWPYISSMVARELIKKGIIAESYPTLEAAREDYMKRNKLKSL